MGVCGLVDYSVRFEENRLHTTVFDPRIYNYVAPRPSRTPHWVCGTLLLWYTTATLFIIIQVHICIKRTAFEFYILFTN